MDEFMHTETMECQEPLSNVVKEESMIKVEVLEESLYQDEFGSMPEELNEEETSEEIIPRPKCKESSVDEEYDESLIAMPGIGSVPVINDVKGEQILNQTTTIGNSISKDNLDEQHVKSPNGSNTNHTKQFKCSSCDYESNHKGDFKRHLLIHSNTKLLKCSMCEYESNHKSEIKIHMLTHLNIKLFKCSVCEYKCNRKGDFNVHMLTHLNFKRFKCSDCDYECNQKRQLSEHMLGHLNVKKFKCPNCDYGCNQTSRLREHMLTHSDIKEFKCSDCDFSCKRKRNLQRHIQTMHTSESKKLHSSTAS